MEKNQTNGENIKPVKIPIKDVLDLHTFAPKEIPSLLKEYLNACRKARIFAVRIIHGKGKGFLKNSVRGLLEGLPIVASFSDAPPCGGGWGATVVELAREIDFESPDWFQILDEGARAMGVSLERHQIAQFAIHAKELVAWNVSTDLTAITDHVEIAVKQFLDNLPVPAFIPPGSRLLDIGSGGGFPGIPLKILRPDLHVTLIDASRKKVNFLKHIIRTIGLEDIEARHIRAEELRSKLQAEARPNVIVSKAVSKLERFLDWAIPLLCRPGIIIAMKGRSLETELEAAISRIEGEGLILTVKEYRLPLLDIQRCLVVLSDSRDEFKACQSPR